MRFYKSRLYNEKGIRLVHFATNIGIYHGAG